MNNDLPFKVFFVFMFTGMGLFLLLFFGSCSVSLFDSYSGRAHQRVQVRAEKFLNELNISHEAISCNSLDTDGNGYITCSYKSNDKIETIECSDSIYIESGCRTLKIKAIENR